MSSTREGRNSSGTPSKTGPKGGLVRLASAEQSTVEQGINNLAVSQPAGGDATTPKSALSGGYLNCYDLAALGIASNPTILATMELDTVA